MEINKEEIIRYFAKKGFLLDGEVADLFRLLDDNGAAEQILNQVVAMTKSRVITRKVLNFNKTELNSLFFNFPKEKAQIFENFLNLNLGLIPTKIEKIEPKKIEISNFSIPKVKILSSNIIPDKKIEVRDFVMHFRNRFNFMKELLKDRKELSNLVSINKIGSNRSFSLLAMISSKRVTKNKNIIFELEDLTGRINALVGLDKEDIFKKAKEVICDDVVGLKCSGGKDFVYINDIFFPDAYLTEKRKSEEEVYCLFVSDMHVGSSLFLEKNFERFIDWINGKDADEFQKEKLSKIKYMFAVGDNVDGVGVYPGQEALLKIKDIKAQYKKLAEYMDRIPKHISIIMCPGQHDASRVPEPQPSIDEEYAEELTKIPNLYLLSNPAMVEIDATDRKKGLKVLMYHGASMHGWIEEIEELRQGKAHMNPPKVVKYMLKHRHLSPMHSSNVYIPSDKEDCLTIKEIPDVVVTGDLHRTDLDVYNNILIISCSCWQSITPFEEKVGNQPDPCKIPMLNLKTREIKLLDFSDAEEPKEEKTCEQIKDQVVCEVKK